MAKIHTFEQYRARYFPQEVERERQAQLTPEQRGQELAQAMLKRVSQAMNRASRTQETI
jgi:hypothetical protein